jgi:hypothetical protein
MGIVVLVPSAQRDLMVVGLRPSHRHELRGCHISSLTAPCTSFTSRISVYCEIGLVLLSITSVQAFQIVSYT